MILSNTKLYYVTSASRIACQSSCVGKCWGDTEIFFNVGLFNQHNDSPHLLNRSNYLDIVTEIPNQQELVRNTI